MLCAGGRGKEGTLSDSMSERRVSVFKSLAILRTRFPVLDPQFDSGNLVDLLGSNLGCVRWRDLGGHGGT